MKIDGRYLQGLPAVILMIALLGVGHDAAVRAAGPQEARENNRIISATGTVSGTIIIKEVSGNNIGNFDCDRIKVFATGLGEDHWSKSAIATGKISSRRCYYNITGVPSGKAFSLSIPTPEFPKACDEKKFDVTFSSFPMTVKTGEKLSYNFTIARIRCLIIA